MRGRRRMETAPTTGRMKQQQKSHVDCDGDKIIQSNNRRWSSNTNNRKCIRKRIRSSFSSSSSHNSMAGGVAVWLPMALLSVFSVGKARGHIQQQGIHCYQLLKNFDIDNDGCLSRSEYVDVISNNLSNDDDDDDMITNPYIFSKLPLHLQETFTSLSKSSTTAAALDGGTISPCIEINDISSLYTICHDLNQFKRTKMTLPHAPISPSFSSSSNILLGERIQQQQQQRIAATETYLPLHRSVEYVSTPATLPGSIQQEQRQQKKRQLHAMDQIKFSRQDDGDCDSTSTIPVTQCRAALVIADTDRDDRLSNDEYVTFVNRLNGNDEFKDDNYDDLPGNVRHVYQKFSGGGGLFIDITGSKPGQSATREQNLFIEQMCCEADIAADNPNDSFPTDSPVLMPPTQSPVGDGGSSTDCEGTIGQVQCSSYLYFADISRDNFVDEDEYLRFIQRLSGNQYPNVPFNELPCNLIKNYEKFATADGGQVDITGGKPGQTATTEQDDHLVAFCCETDLAVQNPGTCQPSTGEPPTLAPEPSMPPITVPSDCLTSMRIADLNRDDYLNEEEYVRFLTRLFSNQFAQQTFDELSNSLQCNFENLADPTRGEIDVSGSKPGQPPNDVHLNEICVSTAEALNTNACDTGSKSPGAQPTEAPAQQTTPPTFADPFCRVAISSSDFNRDDFLNEEEYLHVLNRLTRNDFIDESFDTLEYPLPQTFNCLTDASGQIFIFGAKAGQDANQEQEDFIIEICLAISYALVGDLASVCVGEPTLVPEPTSVPEPTMTPGISEVYNSFIVASSPEIDAEQFESGMDLDELTLAYGIFAERATNELIEREPESILRLRRRRLEVSYLNSSESIYQVIDSECPGSVSEVDSCLTAYASFQVTIDTEDPDEISAFYTSQTQALIADGLLQQVLDERDPQGSLNVLNASFPVRPPTTAPVGTPVPSISPAPTSTNTSMPSLQPSTTGAPTNSSMPSLPPSISLSPTAPNGTETEPPVEAPTGDSGGGEDDEGEKSGGSGVGVAIGVVAVILVLAVAGYFGYKRFGLPPCPSIARVGPKKPGSGSDFKGSDRDGESDNGRDGGFTMDNIFSSSPEKTSPNPFGMDNDDKDTETKGANNAFGDPGGFGFGDSEPKKDDKPANDAFGDGNAFGGLETQQETNNTFDTFGKENNNNFFGNDAFSSPKSASNKKSVEASNIFDNTTTSPGWFGSNTFGDGGGGAGGASSQSSGSGSGSISDVEEDSYRSGDESYRSSQGSRSHVSGEGSRGSRSYYSDDGSRSGSRRSGDESYTQGSRSYQDGSQTYNEDDTYRDEDGTYGEEGGSQGSRSYFSNEQGSQGSRSYYSGSQQSGSHSRRSGSYPSQEGSQTYNEDDTYRDEDGTYGEEGGSQGSRSYYSNEDGSQGSRSYYSDEEGSQGSRSYYSNEDEGSQGSRSYNSDEE